MELNKTDNTSDNLNVPNINRPRVVIIGGGFGGLSLIKYLDKKKFQIVLIDKHNYHTFQPLLYQVATGALEPDSIAYPLRRYVKKYGDIHFRLGVVENIDTKNNQIRTSIGDISYEYLIIATGSKTNYFGNKEIEENAVSMKSVPNALDLRSLILENLELAILQTNHEKRNALLHFVIVGGGPTGVELAGALADLKKYVFREEYHDLNIDNLQITLVEGSDRLLHAMNKKSSKATYDALKKLGVNIHLNSIIKKYDGDKVVIGGGDELMTKNVIWTAGVLGDHPEGIDQELLLPGNRIKVDAYCRMMPYENIFIIGDVACMQLDDLPRGHPMVAPGAIQMGEYVAKSLNTYYYHQKLPAKFKYKDKGSMSTIGRNKAVVNIGRLKFKGAFAWFTWLFIHLMSIVGFRNRLIVFVSWFQSYFTNNTALRLIIRPFVNNKRKGGLG
ncbi:MAG: NAD(P)/FAD-dependent oxidoreductase [Hyphomicrobiales bacterium]